MVLKKRQNYGFDGFLIPSIPRAPRSARGKYLGKRKVEDSQLCAIELLASLAGKLLQESESSSSSNASEANDLPVISDGIKQEKDDVLLKTEHLDVECCEENVFIPEFTSPSSNGECLAKQSPCADSDYILEHSSIITSSNSMEKVSNGVKSESFKSHKVYEDVQQGVNRLGTKRFAIDSPCSSKDPMELCLKLPALIKQDNNTKLSPHQELVHNASILGHRNNTNLGFRDDDEKFSRSNWSISKPKAFRPPPRIADRRIRKLLTSKYWKVAPKLKDCELPNVESLDGGMQTLHCKRKMCYGRERYHRDMLYKRRKFSDGSLVVNSDGGFSSESVCNSPEKGINEDKNGSSAMLHGANGVLSSVMCHQGSSPSKDSQVKFSIKSIRVPELFIEVPETATVASLKKIVMEAVTALLRDGLHVGVLLHGKKVDDNGTLLQTGITSKENLDTLSFTLEPTPEPVPLPPCTDDPPVLLSSDISQLVSRSTATPVVDTGIYDAKPDPLSLTCLDHKVEDNQQPVSSHTDIITDTAIPDSKALVAVPPVNVEALAVVPVNQKSKRTELVQRRTRRPFSVTEVEALVTSVEELGTGRWRDVKLRSFENADHRTYVDLKDKWKTLVHTAKITPQQRRGEPVPQELLDRVLAAHAYWSEHQGRPHNKNQTAANVKTADTHADKEG